jgi:hypothetical protein
MYLYLTFSISYGVNLYLDLQNINKFNSVQFNKSAELQLINGDESNNDVFIPLTAS